jgi:hypothetical protein
LIHDTELKAQLATDWIEQEALENNPSVSLQIHHESVRCMIPGSARGGIKTAWVNYALDNIWPGDDVDGDGHLSDDVAVWQQRIEGYDHVVIGFHVIDNDQCSAVADIDQELAGPLVVYYGANLDWKAYAHEFLHAFGACDEHHDTGGCLCVCDNVYIPYGYGAISTNGETNGNCPGCSESGSIECIMEGGGIWELICDYTRHQIGWGDADTDGVADANDTADGLGLEVASITAMSQWREWTTYGQFYVTDVAGGELKVAPKVDSIATCQAAGVIPRTSNSSSKLAAY